MTLSNSTIEKSTFTAIPGETDPKSLMLFYQKKLANSLYVYLKKLMETLKIDFIAQIGHLENLDPNKRFSPALFAGYIQLKEAYDKKNIQASLDAVQFLKTLSRDQIYAEIRSYGTILTEQWENSFVAELRNANPQDDFGRPLAKSVQILPLVHWKKDAFPPKELKDAEDLMEQFSHGLWNEFATYVSNIKLFSSRTMQGATSPRFFGNIFLRLPYPSEDSVLFYLEHIVHETSHLHLFAMMGEDPLFLNEENELFVSPIRPDKRPMMGIFHATFVLARIAGVFRRYLETHPTNRYAKETLKKTEKSFSEGYDIVKNQARLTSAGKDICNTLEICAFD